MANKKWGAGRLAAVLAPLFWFGILSGIAALLDNPLILPQPWQIIVRLAELCLTGDFYRTVALSLLRILAGLGIGVAIGSLIGLTSFLFPLLRALLRPLLTVVRSTPVASLVILIWSMVGGKNLPFFIAALMVIPIAADQLITGLDSASPTLREVVSVYGIPPLRSLLIYRLPAALPYFFGAIVTSAGFAWKAGIAAEILATAKNSIGLMIYDSKVYMETADLWAWTLTVILMSLLLETVVKKTLQAIERRTKWKA